MSRVSGNGYFDSEDNEEARYKVRVAINKQRTEDFKNGEYKLAGGVDAFTKLKGDNKELILIPHAVHTDLYDKIDIIPFDKIDDFFKRNLK